MDSETILKMLATRQADRFLKGNQSVRVKLGNIVDLYAFQERMLATLILTPSMGPVLYEAARKVAIQATKDAIEMTSKLQNYHSLANADNREEATLSTELKLLQNVCESTGTGLLQLSQYERNKLIVFQVDECAECFALPDIGKPVCYYTAGDLAGSIETVLSRKVGFVESKCRAKGDQICEFRSIFKVEVDEWER